MSGKNYRQRRYSSSSSSPPLQGQGERTNKKFPDKLWYVVCDEMEDSCLWTANGDSILINKGKFSQRFLSSSNHLFRTSNFKSFVRQLNLYGFRKVNKMRRHDYEIWWEYRNENFIRDRPDLLRLIRRKAAIDDEILEIENKERAVKKKRETKPVTTMFNLRLAQLNDGDGDGKERSKENVASKITGNPKVTTPKLGKCQIVEYSVEKRPPLEDCLFTLMNGDNEGRCYELFENDEDMEDATAKVDRIIIKLDSTIQETDQVLDYSMRNMSKQVDKEDKVNNSEQQLISTPQQKPVTLAEMNFIYSDDDRPQKLNEEPFVINIPSSQKQIWDTNESFITVSLFPDLPSSQGNNSIYEIYDLNEITQTENKSQTPLNSTSS